MNPETRPENPFWLPPQLSTIAAESDWMNYFIHYTSVAAFIAIVGTMLWFMWRYRRRPGVLPTRVKDHQVMELVWVFTPLLFLTYLFHKGFVSYVKTAVAPPNAYDVRVIAKKWDWAFEYPNGSTSAAMLVVPANRPIRLVMTSNDVIHSFFVPDFRIKKDVVPGMFSTVWFETSHITHRFNRENSETRFLSPIDVNAYSDLAPEVSGAFDAEGKPVLLEGGIRVYCTEYCGKSHSLMRATIRVVTQEDFDQWLEIMDKKPDGLTETEWGERLFTQNGCPTCHSPKSSLPPHAREESMTGPNLYGIFGTQVRFADGTSAPTDEEYLRTSIINPNDKYVTGFPNGGMSSFAHLGRKAEHLNALVAYIKSLHQ